MTRVQGIICPILTPMEADESVNEAELRRQVRRQLAAGIHGIFAFGTNGEGYALDDGEKRRILEAVVDEVRGQVPVYAGSGAITTRDTIRLSRMARSAGADVLSIITPSFAKASQEELYSHYAAVARAVSAPILLYHIPARTGNTLEPGTVERLSRVDPIVGVKDSSGDPDLMLRYIERTRDRSFRVLSGNDALILTCLTAGGAGGVSGCANVFPRTMVRLYDAFVRGDLEQARACQDSIRPFRDCFRFGNPNTIVKTAVALLGYPVGKCRSPFNEVPEAGMAALREVIAEVKAHDME